MKKSDIKYFNSWEGSFKNCSPAQVMRALLEGIWISSNEDPEDIYLVYPKLVVRAVGSTVNNYKQFGMCPFEFSFEDHETYRWERWEEGGECSLKGRRISDFGYSWTLDPYEMRKAITKRGLEISNIYKITKEEIEALHKKYLWDDKAAYQDLMANRPDLNLKTQLGYAYNAIDEHDYRCVRAAFVPHCDPRYKWMDYPEKAGFPNIPNIDNRPSDWSMDD